MNEIDEIFDKLFNFFGVSTITDLSKKLEMSQPAVTNWQRRNSISAIKKKCRELGIYNDIFGDLNSNIQSINTISGGQNAQKVNGNQVYNSDKNKLQNIDNVTVELFIEVYEKAKETNDIKGLRLYLMDYCDG